MAVNIAQREDIPAATLRQRRDLYALGIALTIFYLAGGEVLSQGTQGIIPLQLKNPWVVLVAAWIGFFYFLARYRMMKGHSEAWSEFRSDWSWQMSKHPKFRHLVLEVIPMQYVSETVLHARRMIEQGCVPLMSRQKSGIWVVGLSEIRTPGKKENVQPSGLGEYTLSEEASKKMTWLWRRHILSAIANEHTFTNYLFPYYFAAIPIFILFFVEGRRLATWINFF